MASLQLISILLDLKGPEKVRRAAPLETMATITKCPIARNSTAPHWRCLSLLWPQEIPTQTLKASGIAETVVVGRDAFKQTAVATAAGSSSTPYHAVKSRPGNQNEGNAYTLEVSIMPAPCGILVEQKTCIAVPIASSTANGVDRLPFQGSPPGQAATLGCVQGAHALFSIYFAVTVADQPPFLCTLMPLAGGTTN
jgi:hypothetical protein